MRVLTAVERARYQCIVNRQKGARTGEEWTSWRSPNMDEACVQSPAVCEVGRVTQAMPTILVLGR